MFPTRRGLEGQERYVQAFVLTYPHCLDSHERNLSHNYEIPRRLTEGLNPPARIKVLNLFLVRGVGCPLFWILEFCLRSHPTLLKCQQ